MKYVNQLEAHFTYDNELMHTLHSTKTTSAVRGDEPRCEELSTQPLRFNISDPW